MIPASEDPLAPSTSEPIKRGDRHSSPESIDRPPPFSPEAELGVLSCMMQDPDNCVGEALDFLKGGSESFYDLRHQTIFNTIVEMSNKRQIVDLITLQQNLKDKQILEQVGGLVFLSEVFGLAPSPAGISHYLEIVREKHILRRLIATCSGVAGKVYDYSGEVDKLVSEVEREILEVRGKFESGRGETKVKHIINQMADNFERAMRGERPYGLSTGLRNIDRIMGTMKGQEMITIAATPSAGKTTLLMNIFYRLAQGGIKTGFINLDTSSYSTVFRLSCLAGQVDGQKCEDGTASDYDIQKMVVGSGKIAEYEDIIKIRDDVNNESRLIAACRKMKQQGCKLIGVDFMQQLTCNGSTRYERISRSAEVIKGLAKELDIPMVAISSLNRGDTTKPNKRPTMQDLNGSGDIEYYSNKVILLHCEDRESSTRDVDVDIAKNKDGRCGKTKLTMFASQFRFEDAAMEQPK